MKLFNIFKKETTTISKANIQPLEKKQLEKVIGGGAINTSRSNIKSPSGATEPGTDPGTTTPTVDGGFGTVPNP